VVSWVLVPFDDAVGYHRLEGPCCLHLQGEMMKMEAARSPEMSVSYHVHSRCHNPGDHDMNLCRRENLKTRTRLWMCSA